MVDVLKPEVLGVGGLLLEFGEERVEEETSQKGKVFIIQQMGFIGKRTETTKLDDCAGFLEGWVKGKE